MSVCNCLVYARLSSCEVYDVARASNSRGVKKHHRRRATVASSSFAIATQRCVQPTLVGSSHESHSGGNFLSLSLSFVVDRQVLFSNTAAVVLSCGNIDRWDGRASAARITDLRRRTFHRGATRGTTGREPWRGARAGQARGRVPGASRDAHPSESLGRHVLRRRTEGRRRKEQAQRTEDVQEQQAESKRIGPDVHVQVSRRASNFSHEEMGGAVSKSRETYLPRMLRSRRRSSTCLRQNDAVVRTAQRPKHETGHHQLRNSRLRRRNSQAAIDDARRTGAAAATRRTHPSVPRTVDRQSRREEKHGIGSAHQMTV